MKAPDKIYLNIPKDQPVTYNNDVLEIATWSTKEFADCKNIEYIRKDYLLEWLEDMKFMANSERAGAYQNMIDKLNQM